ERDATATLIAHMAELYGRRLHERAGYGSLFTYGVEVLHLSESAAYDRMKAAKIVRRYPLVLAMLAEGRVNLTNVRLVAPHLTRANHLELLAAVASKSKRQVQVVLAGRFPQPDVAPSVRKLPSRVISSATQGVCAPIATDLAPQCAEAAPVPTPTTGASPRV